MKPTVIPRPHDYRYQERTSDYPSVYVANVGLPPASPQRVAHSGVQGLLYIYFLGVVLRAFLYDWRKN